MDAVLLLRYVYISFELGQVYQVDNTVGTFTYVCMLPPTQHDLLQPVLTSSTSAHYQFMARTLIV